MKRKTLTKLTACGLVGALTVGNFTVGVDAAPTAGITSYTTNIVTSSVLPTAGISLAMSECADVGRRRGRQSFLTEEDLARLTEEPVPADQTEVWDQVADLYEPDRSIVYLYYGEGYSLKEIAQMLGLTHGNCRVILHRARKKLKEKLAGKQTAERRRHGRVREISEYDEKHSCAGRT